MEHESLLDKLADLWSVAAALDSTSDTLIDELKAIERALAELGIHFPVTTSYAVNLTYLGEPPEESEGGTKVWRDWTEHRLGYGKFDGAWRILLTKYRIVEPDPDDLTLSNEVPERTEPLLDASPDLLTEAAGWIKHLVGRIAVVAEKKLAELLPRQP